jgi:hypothetical protein
MATGQKTSLTPAPVLPARRASTSSMQSPPMSTEEITVMAFSPTLALQGMPPRSTNSSTRSRTPSRWASVAVFPALSTP